MSCLVCLLCGSSSEGMTTLRDLSDVEAAWLGGWLSSDGSILPGPPPKIRWVICDRDVLERIAYTIGKNQVGGPRPWLSERYCERLDEAHRRWQPRPHLGRKLDPTAVRAIRSEPQRHGVLTSLAKKHGVTISMIGAIRAGRAWQGVI